MSGYNSMSHLGLENDLVPPEMLIAMKASYHIGRSWSGHKVEDGCPCPSQPCGLVVPQSGCEEHDPRFAQTIRQLHKAAECPGE